MSRSQHTHGRPDNSPEWEQEMFGKGPGDPDVHGHYPGDPDQAACKLCNPKVLSQNKDTTLEPLSRR